MNEIVVHEQFNKLLQNLTLTITHSFLNIQNVSIQYLGMNIINYTISENVIKDY